MQISPPYLLFLGDAQDQLAIKTAAGVYDWRKEWCIGKLRLPDCKADLPLPEYSIQEAKQKGAKTLVIGLVNAGGILPDNWTETIIQAIEAGFDIVAGMHSRLADTPEIVKAAIKTNVKLHDLRFHDLKLPTGKGNKRTGKRILTVGTDCSVGKKYTALALEQELQKLGLKATFRATGQTGILLSGRGIAIDAVKADFISGACEWLTPDNDKDHYDIIEGQGSLFHPSFAGVSLGLLHGAQADGFIVCHEPTRKTMRGVDYALPSIQDVIGKTIQLGSLTNPSIKCCGLAINTQNLSESEAQDYIGALTKQFDLPVTDPIRFGATNLAEFIKSNI